MKNFLYTLLLVPGLIMLTGCGKKCCSTSCETQTMEEEESSDMTTKKSRKSGTHPKHVNWTKNDLK